MFTALTKWYSGDKIMKNEMEGARGMHRERRAAYRAFVGKLKIKTLLGKPRHR